MKHRLSQILKEKNISQAKFAKMTGESQPQISRLCKNKLGMSAAWIAKIIDKLDITPNELFGIEDRHKLDSDFNEEKAILVTIMILNSALKYNIDLPNEVVVNLASVLISESDPNDDILTSGPSMTDMLVKAYKKTVTPKDTNIVQK